MGIISGENLIWSSLCRQQWEWLIINNQSSISTVSDTVVSQQTHFVQNYSELIQNWIIGFKNLKDINFMVFPVAQNNQNV